MELAAWALPGTLLVASHWDLNKESRHDEQDPYATSYAVLAAVHS